MRRARRSRGSRGFTLVEVAAVTIILALLAGVVSFGVKGIIDSRKKNVAAIQVKSLAAAVRMFDLDCGSLPAALDDLVRRPSSESVCRDWKRFLDERRIPLDPWKHAYRYRTPGEDGMDFDIWSTGPDGLEGTEDDVGSRDPPD